MRERELGYHLLLLYGVCMGKKEEGKVPVIGDDVFIGLGVKVLGDMKIPSGSIIAPNAVVLQCPEDAKVVWGVPSKVLKYL